MERAGRAQRRRRFFFRPTAKNTMAFRPAPKAPSPRRRCALPAHSILKVAVLPLTLSGGPWEEFPASKIRPGEGEGLVLLLESVVRAQPAPRWCCPADSLAGPGS